MLPASALVDDDAFAVVVDGDEDDDAVMKEMFGISVEEGEGCLVDEEKEWAKDSG